MRNILLLWYSKYKIHLLVWTLYMLYESVVIGFMINSFGNPIIYISHYLVFVFFFYLHADWVLPLIARNKRNAFWILPILILIQAFCYVTIQYSVAYLLAICHISESKPIVNTLFISRNLYRAMLYLGFSTGYYFLKTYFQERKRTTELEKAQLNTIIVQQRIEQELANVQNAYLKAQINPHFLFNTLDFVYHKVNIHSEVAGEAVLRLSEMMRFAIASDQMDMQINLADEIEQVENLIYLYQARKNRQLNVEFSYTQAVIRLRFIPLVLLTLVENIFKHGNLTNIDSKAIIALDVTQGVFQIYTNNLIHLLKSPKSNYSGLNNIQKRLNYAYGEHVQFTYKTTDDHHFYVKIAIPVNALK